MPGDSWKAFDIHLNFCFFISFLFFLTGLSLWVVSKKSRHLGFCVD